jgi:hypothetical protein
MTGRCGPVVVLLALLVAVGDARGGPGCRLWRWASVGAFALMRGEAPAFVPVALIV